jgi:putative ABC transport system ATP-binding protein
MNNLILGTGLSKNYSLSKQISVPALRGVDLAIQEGEFISIVGPSGSGKSTLLNLIGLMEPASEGKLLLEGRDVAVLNDVQRTAIRAEKIGFVFQTFNLLPALTALENVEFAMRAVGGKNRWTKAKRLNQAREKLERVGLEQRMNHLPSGLSGGERQRVAIARSLANNPKLILADEPTGNLDSAASESVIRLLHEIHAAGTTVIMVTHNMDTTRDTRFLKMRDGAILQA